MRIASVWVLVVVASCTQGPDPPCDHSLLYSDSGWTLATLPGTTSPPTVVFADANDGAHPDTCHYSRNQGGDAFCTEAGGWTDLNPGERSGTINISVYQHGCAGFQTGHSYALQYSFDQVPGSLWIMVWSANQ